MYPKANWHFGAGRLIYRTQTGTPVPVATLQEVDVDISATTKDLIGENQYPEASVRAGMKISGKVQTGRFDGRVISNLYLGASEEAGTIAKGLLVAADREPYTVDQDGTVALNLGEAQFDTDLGVIDVATGGAFKWVAANPAAGEYTYDANGMYAFDEGSAGRRVMISFVKSVAGQGETTTITNDLMGEGPTFEMISFDKKGLYLQLYCCQFSKLSLQRKNEDFLIPNLEFSAYADDVRGVGRLSIPASAAAIA